MEGSGCGLILTTVLVSARWDWGISRKISVKIIFGLGFNPRPPEYEGWVITTWWWHYVSAFNASRMQWREAKLSWYPTSPVAACCLRFKLIIFRYVPLLFVLNEFREQIISGLIFLLRTLNTFNLSQNMMTDLIWGCCKIQNENRAVYRKECDARINGTDIGAVVRYCGNLF